MKNMKKDYQKTILVILIGALLVFGITRSFFLEFANEYKLIGGFIKFFFLATIGDFIGLRIKSKEWRIPKYVIAKAIVWGLIGVSIVLMFKIFTVGVMALQASNILPFAGVNLAFAFFVSLLMNFTYAPTMMAFHRVTDTYLDLRKEYKKVKIENAIEYINWKQFINFAVFKTIPFFWVPAHTITFLLPEEYRVIFAALLGIFLGAILGLFKNEKKN